MSNFNYQEYLKDNPLLKEEVKDQLITESQDIEETVKILYLKIHVLMLNKKDTKMDLMMLKMM